MSARPTSSACSAGPPTTSTAPGAAATPPTSPCWPSLLQRVSQGRPLVVALEPTGTYGDALRHALGQAGLAVHRVSPKAAADYAETFDGVPSQHDGKDAAVVAELAAQGAAGPGRWSYPTRSKGSWPTRSNGWTANGGRRNCGTAGSKRC